MDDLAGAEFSNNDISGYSVGLCVQTPGARIRKNSVTNSCIGAFVDPGVTDAKLTKNNITALNPACSKADPAGGILVDGAIRAIVEKNIVEGQSLGGFAGGIVVVDDMTTPTTFVASGNVVKHNILQNNDIDLFVNTTGTGNVVANNKCSTPAQLCT
jgi:hypothetical protein